MGAVPSGTQRTWCQECLQTIYSLKAILEEGKFDFKDPSSMSPLDSRQLSTLDLLHMDQKNCETEISFYIGLFYMWSLR